jgi:hypothetical protein
MLDITTFRLAKIIADERIQIYKQREPTLVFCYGGFKLHRRLLSYLASVLIHVGTKLATQFTNRPKPAVSQANS